MNILIALLVSIIFLTAFILFRTLRFRDHAVHVEPLAAVDIDEGQIARHVSEAVKIRTILANIMNIPITCVLFFQNLLGQLLSCEFRPGSLNCQGFMSIISFIRHIHAGKT